jgi:selenocysteine lyase/cysteine desulfurase
MKHFEPGHQDTLNFGSLEQSILNFERIGVENISEKVQQLTQYAKNSFTERGLLDEAVVQRNHHSNIFNLKGDQALFKKLAENKIICSLRGSGIRVGFHFYNTKEEIDRLLAVFDEV